MRTTSTRYALDRHEAIQTHLMPQILHTNLNGVINGLNAYVPNFQSRNAGAIVITGSKQGITNPPGNAAYNASKAAVKTLPEHLSFDLKDTGVSIHLLVPGYTFTGLVCLHTPIQNHKLKQTQSGNVPGANKHKPDSAWSGAQVADFMCMKMDEAKFYIMCPDNDVSEELDKKRMLWSVGDIVNGRPPLTRWRPEFKEEAEEWMAKQKV
jgi:NAD(P)-dependent dehydrogenase (short-subunit alcohol dehydrogenase family)